MSENKLIDRSFLRHLLITLFFIGLGLFGFWLDKGNYNANAAAAIMHGSRMVNFDGATIVMVDKDTMGRLVSLQRECIGKPEGTKGFGCSFRENKEFIKLINPKAPAISYLLKARSPDGYLPLSNIGSIRKRSKTPRSLPFSQMFSGCFRLPRVSMIQVMNHNG